MASMFKLLWRSLTALAAVGVVTVVGEQVLRLNALTVGFTYLVVVLVIASAWGFVESVLASIAATLCFNYFFFPPVRTFTISDPQNWVAVFAFLTTALIGSRLSTKAEQRARDAMERQQDLER